MPSLLSEPVLTLAFDNIHKLRSIDCDNLFSMWTVFTKCKENLLNGERLENLSWRLWFRQASSERNYTQLDTVEFGRKFNSDTSPENYSKSAPTTGGCVTTTFNGIPRQFSTSCLRDLISPISSNLELIEIDTDSSPSTLDELDINVVSSKKSDNPKCVESISDNESQLATQEYETTLDVSIKDRKRKIFFIADSLEEEGFPISGAVEKFKNSRTVMDLQALAQLSNSSAPDFSESLDSESMMDDDEDWESIASSYQSTLSTSSGSSTSSSCVFEKIQVPKQTTQYEPSKPSLLSTLFQRCSSTSIPYSKPSLFKGLCTLSSLDSEYEQDPLAKELSESLHQNVLWQRQQHEHFCRPCRKQQTYTIQLEDSIVTSPGYNGCGW